MIKELIAYTEQKAAMMATLAIIDELPLDVALAKETSEFRSLLKKLINDRDKRTNEIALHLDNRTHNDFRILEEYLAKSPETINISFPPEN